MANKHKHKRDGRYIDYVVEDGEEITASIFALDGFKRDMVRHFGAIDTLDAHKPGFRLPSRFARDIVRTARNEMIDRARSGWLMDKRRPPDDDDDDDDPEVQDARRFAAREAWVRGLQDAYPPAIGKLRVEMLSIAQDLQRIRHAPLPVADQVAAAEQYVAQRAAYSGPRIGVLRDQLQLQWPDDVVGSKQDMLGVLCWLAPTSVAAALKREIETQPSPANALPAADRNRRVQELEARLLDIERRERRGMVLPWCRSPSLTRHRGMQQGPPWERPLCEY
jgi:hypothetical protein